MRSFGQRLWRYLTDHIRWFKKGGPYWLVALVPLVSWLVAWWLVVSDCEPRIRWLGMIFELAGLSTVAWGLRETRKLFVLELPPAWKRLREYVDERPRWRRDLHLHVEGAAFIMTGGDVVMAHGVAKPSPDTTVEQRLTLLEHSVEIHSKALFEQQRRAIDEARKQAGAQKSETDQRKQADQELHVTLREAVAGGLMLEAIGVAFILLGIILATASQELSRWVCW